MNKKNETGIFIGTSAEAGPPQFVDFFGKNRAVPNANIVAAGTPGFGVGIDTTRSTPDILALVGVTAPATSNTEEIWNAVALMLKFHDQAATTNEEKGMFGIAMIEMLKRIPMAPIVERWEPNRCPTCDKDLGGKCNDGYYENHWHEFCPACGQKLDYTTLG